MIAADGEMAVTSLRAVRISGGSRGLFLLDPHIARNCVLTGFLVEFRKPTGAVETNKSEIKDLT